METNVTQTQQPMKNKWNTDDKTNGTYMENKRTTNGNKNETWRTSS